MNRSRRGRRSRSALLLAAAVGLAPGCTLFDDYTSGTPFTLDQPSAEVTLVGEINVSAAGSGTKGCTPGRTLFWGVVRNTGDVDVDDVSIVVDAYGGSGALLGSFAAPVYNGDFEEGSETTLGSASTSLEVDQAGSFEVCTPIPYGSVARTEYRTDFIYIDESDS